jgi:hypothetical protein
VLAIPLSARQWGKTDLSSASRTLISGAILLIAGSPVPRPADLGADRQLR